MNESFLHYIWQSQYFNKNELKTTEGESVVVYKPGMLNTNSGPDFSNAKIKIDTIEWVGHVEIHLRASDWQQHHHQHDAAYNNVVLHVVWQNDEPVYAKDKSLIPTLELKNRVDQTLIDQYKKIIANASDIPCEQLLPDVPVITRVAMLDKAMVERLQTKAEWIRALYRKGINDWDETTYQVIAKNFGFKINSDPFLTLAERLPYKIILKQSQLYQVEALVFGIAGFLEAGMKDDYFNALKKEFALLKTKYQLTDKVIEPAQWRFLRLRPANFPTIRLAQFSALLWKNKNLFSKIVESSGYKELTQLFDVSQSEYWKEHYRFGKKSAASISGTGSFSIDNIIINSVAPLLSAYGMEKAEPAYIERAQEILQQLPAEANAITRTWSKLDWSVKTAFDSQALIELYNTYCKRRNCLSCTIGASLIKPGR